MGARAPAPASAPVQAEAQAGAVDPVESQRRAERLGPMPGMGPAGRAQAVEPPEWVDKTRARHARAVSPNPAMRVL